jgi:hypothetical protein
MLFQLLDLKRDRRLGHEQYLGRFGEAQLFGNSVKNLKSSVCHKGIIRKFNGRIFNHKSRIKDRSKSNFDWPHGTPPAFHDIKKKNSLRPS